MFILGGVCTKYIYNGGTYYIKNFKLWNGSSVPLPLIKANFDFIVL